MANCDWGRPCTCRECRTQYRKEICPMCSFNNVVELEGTGVIKTGRKGMSYADITMPTGNTMNLECVKCGYVINNVGFYTRLAVDACQFNLKRDELKKSSRPCDDCNSNIQDSIGGYQSIELFEHNGKFVCKECLSKRIEAENPDPSNKNEKYIFNKHELKWVLSKVRVICESCGKPRWLKQENSWKTQCLSCYKKV